jgi:hypothetical protein
VPAKLRRGGGGRWFEFPTHEGGEDGAVLAGEPEIRRRLFLVLVAGKGNENYRSTDKKRKENMDCRSVKMKARDLSLAADTNKKEVRVFKNYTFSPCYLMGFINRV